MNENINLIRRTKESKEKREISKYLNLSAIICLSAVLFFAVLFFIIKTAIVSPSLINEEKNLLAQISSLNKRTAKIIFIKNRLINILDIEKNRADLTKYMDTIFNSSQNISVDSLSFGKKELTVTISSFSLLDINSFIDKIQEIFNSGNEFKKVDVNNLSVDGKTGKYVLTVDIEL